MEKTKPIHTIRIGNIQASIWENDTKYGVLYNTTFSRVYEEKGKVHGSYSFAPRDLYKLLGCLFEAREFIASVSPTPSRQEDTPEGDEF